MSGAGGMYAGGIKELAAARPCPESLRDPDRTVSVDNPFCGDRVDLEIKIEEGRVTALAQKVRGCMLCEAAANALARSAQGLSLAEIEAARDSLQAMLRGVDTSEWPPGGWEALASFEPVRRHKSRHGCVLLPFTALVQALSRTD
ncbi:MAG: iron-sulfur cluster assembly scaffold protein [Halioglobus sp.]|nr:iron-sulfur cluster assembly scaffold protein [Halioglobus sp.]